MEVDKNRFFINREGKLVRIISNPLDPFDMFVALANPRDPNLNNVYYVCGNGRSVVDPKGDLQRDVTCTQCNGKGTYIAIYGIDDARKRACGKCQSKGYID